jgi:hypothetical protein
LPAIASIASAHEYSTAASASFRWLRSAVIVTRSPTSNVAVRPRQASDASDGSTLTRAAQRFPIDSAERILKLEQPTRAW